MVMWIAIRKKKYDRSWNWQELKMSNLSPWFGNSESFLIVRFCNWARPRVNCKARFILLTPSVSDYLPRRTPAASNSCRRRWHALTWLGSMNAPASSLIFASEWARITLSSNDVTDLCAWLSKNTRVRVSVRACLHEWASERTKERTNE